MDRRRVPYLRAAAERTDRLCAGHALYAALLPLREISRLTVAGLLRMRSATSFWDSPTTMLRLISSRSDADSREYPVVFIRSELTTSLR